MRSLKPWEVKTVVDTARGKNPCPKARKFIEKLDEKYEGVELGRKEKTRHKRSWSILDWLFGSD